MAITETPSVTEPMTGAYRSAPAQRPAIALVPIAAELVAAHRTSGPRRMGAAAATIAGALAVIVLVCRGVAHGLDPDVEVDPALER
jgi:hypothetical protein